jgi:hypothetical protein
MIKPFLRVLFRADIVILMFHAVITICSLQICVCDDSCNAFKSPCHLATPKDKYNSNFSDEEIEEAVDNISQMVCLSL